MKAGFGLFLLSVVLTGCGKPAHTVNVSCEQMFLEQLRWAAEQRQQSDIAASEITAKFNELRELHDPKVDAILNRQTLLEGRYVPECEDIRTGRTFPCPGLLDRY
jgi:hypothetical protein